MERTLLDQDGSNCAAPFIKPCLHCCTARIGIRVGPQVKSRVCRKEHSLKQLIDIGALLRGNINKHSIATVLFRYESVLSELSADFIRIGALNVDLIDCYHNRHMRCLRMVDSFHCLRHHTVIGCYHEDRNICEFRTAGTHGGKRFMARGIKESDAAVYIIELNMYLICTNALRDAASLVA